MCAHWKNPPHGVQHGVDRGVPQPSVVQVADVELEVGPLQSDERVQAVGLAPGEPAAQLVGVQPVSLPGVPSQVRDGRELGGCHRVGLERQNDGAGYSGLRRSGDHDLVADRREDVPSSVELRWRPGEHQAALMS